MPPESAPADQRPLRGKPKRGLAVAVGGLCWLVGLHAPGVSAPPPPSPRCPIHLRVTLDKPLFTYWEIVTGSVGVSNADREAVQSTFTVTLFRAQSLFHKREVAVEIPPGRKTYDLASALGFVPLVPPKPSPS